MNQLSSQLNAELKSILDYWSGAAVDERWGGFIGQIGGFNQKNCHADKGLVLNARILWTYSAAFKFSSSQRDLDLASRAFEYIITHFYDNVHKGFYWLVNYEGQVKDQKKHIYAQAFAVYGLSEYYRISGNIKALELAVETYRLIIDKSKDLTRGGFTEAFSVDWQKLDDARLSAKDINVQKTMNTHLHIAEAFANLYDIWKDGQLKHELISILHIIDKKFIDKDCGHLKLFFDDNWIDHTDVISYGHEVEAAWLLLHCAQISGDDDLIQKYTFLAIQLIDSCFHAIDHDGGLWYERSIGTGDLIREKHWWPQAELMIGTMNAFQLSGDQNYMDQCISNWNFIKSNIKDPAGEWFWGTDENNLPMRNKDKAGFWKCPYHNSRMCLEIIKRINNQNK